MTRAQGVPPGLGELLAQRVAGARLVEVVPLRPDVDTRDATHKGIGYGVPLRLTLVDEATGARRQLVLRFVTANEFGHDRRADRAAELLLAYDTWGRIPCHVGALDVGAVRRDGRLVSLRDTGEFWLLSEWAPGQLYADDLRRLAASGAASPVDVTRADTLANYLVQLHAAREDDRVAGAIAYRRAIRDLVGHGEGIFGLIDSYPDDVPAAPPARLRAIEERCVAWRWRLRGRAARLCRTHGDFHPFNVLFDGPAPVLLDASRGGRGDPADDAVCMAVNYVFFALDAPASWARGLGPLWRTFWGTYLAGSGDRALGEVAAPFFAWRGLVLASPRWYPDLSARARDRLLGFVEAILAAPRFEPAAAERLFP